MKQQAVALRFLPEKEMAPRVVASGEGRIAQEILRLAGENGVTVYKDPLLAESLGRLSLGDEIPDNLYKAVAVVFGFLLEKDPSQDRKPGQE